MLRYQASIHSGDQYDSNDTDTCHAHLQPSTIASSNGSRGQQQQHQQGRLIKRQPPPTYKSIPTSRLAPRRRYFMMDASQKSHSNSSSAGSSFQFPGPDYLKRMKENYENGKIIYIRRNVPGLKNSSIPQKMTSTITNSIRSTTYHTTSTIPSGKVTVETNGSVPKYVFRLPKTEFGSTGGKFDENRPNSNNMYVPAHEPIKLQYTTVPACMSMGGEYMYEEEVEDEAKESEPVQLVEGVVKKEEDEDCAYLKSSGQLVHYSSTGTTTSSSSNSSTPSYNNNSSNGQNSTFRMLPLKNRLQPTRFTCPQQDCFWRGPTDMALRKHMQVHGPKQPVIYSGNKQNSSTNSNDPQVKVQLVQPKPKGVKCSECDTFAYSRPLLLRHMHDSHGIEAPLIRRTFANREMLQTWLDSLRETHAVEFVVSSGSKKWGRGLQVHYLTCSRSGDQKERPNKKYVRPPRPSIKCGRNCMAYLKIKQNPTVSELQIEGCLHHSGHEIDHTRMMLEPNELASIGCIVDAVNEGMDIMGSVETLRSYLGNSGRFRLVNDRGIIEQMPIWFDQYHRAMSEYINDGNHPPIQSMYRGSGALTMPPAQNHGPGQLRPARRINFTNRDIKREMDYEYKSVPIRFNSTQMQRNYGGIGGQQGFTQALYDEKKIKIEIEDEDNLAAQSLFKDEGLMEMKHEDIFDSPMIGGEESRLMEDDDILCGGEEAAGITSTIDGILSANLPDNFGDVMCGVDDLNTDFNCGMDDAEFNELLGFDFDQRGSINCS